MINNLPPQNTVSENNFTSALKSPGLFRPVPEVNQIKATDNDIRRPHNDFISRGELLEVLNTDHQFRRKLNQQIAPENEQALNLYQKIAFSELELPDRQGQVVNFYI